MGDEVDETTTTIIIIITTTTNTTNPSRHHSNYSSSFAKFQEKSEPIHCPPADMTATHQKVRQKS
jgi:hypothetical protein